MKTSDSIKAIGQALSKAQGEMVSAAFDRTGGFKNPYASLASYIATTRAALAANGLCLVQTHAYLEGRTVLYTRLIHGESGEWIEGEIYLSPKAANDPGAVMGANTYARRMALGSMLNVFQDEAEEIRDTDDDGQAASAEELDEKGRPKSKPPSPAPKPSKPPKPPLKPVAPVKTSPGIEKILTSFNKFGVSKADIETRYQKDIDRLTQEEVNELIQIGKALAEKKALKAEFFTEAPTPLIRNQRLRDLVSSIPEQPVSPEFNFEEFDPTRKDDTT